ncbi:uncharacterized protein FA14DRAFT_85299 [Meira miltonrushii]|uniref:Sec39 domain-containing protein n=1 Tax=Meira miltonrushii TaxID=1280837 RepID=A0A316V9I2_9BASI|nr:uncharacterized protein FA14DRAFT_85299 [Meira miltonrushii]PWN32145.1 hypothetical protein FA14DRAFT_85299 [Meira miltonrushii]
MTSKENRRLKRRWLYAIGAIKTDSRAASSSSIVPLSQSLVDETLGSINGEENNLWLATACIDAIRSGLPPLQDDPILLRHILAIGLRATESSTRSAEDALDGPEQTLHLLAARATILRYARLLDVWNKVFGPEADRFASRWDVSTGKDGDTKAVENEEDEYDAWAELAETTPSPIAPQSMRSSALTFVSSSPVQKAMELAMAGQALQLSSFLRALPKALALEIFPQRYTIVKALLMSSAVLQTDLSILVRSEVLPSVVDGKESGLWIRIGQVGPQDEQDFSDLPEIQRLLQNRKLLNRDAQLFDFGDVACSDALDQVSVMNFYRDTTLEIEQQTGSVFFAAQLATFASSNAFGASVNEGIVRLSEDLQLFLPLIHGRASSAEAKQWSLQSFCRALQSASDPIACASLASLYLENVEDRNNALEALRNGVLPLLRASIKRSSTSSLDSGTLASKVRSRIIDLYLLLAEKGKVTTLSYLLLSDDDSLVALDLDKKAQILLAIILTSEVTDRRTLDVLQNLVSTLGSSMVNLNRTDPSSDSTDIKPLKDIVTSTLTRSIAIQPTPSVVFKLFNESTIVELTNYLQRAQACQQAALRLSMFVESVKVAWLASLEGSRDEQLAGVTRLVRSFSRSASHAQMYSQFANTLRADAGPRQAFDQISRKDVAKIVLEGASRVGDIHIFDQVLRSETNEILDAQEQEDIIVDASEELYDNSTTANLHQGDMKMAYDLLSRAPQTKRVQQFKAFIEATSRLCSYRVPSKIHANALLLPIEIRISSDLLDLIRRLLGTRSDAYRTPDMILDVANKLCAIPPGARGDTSAGPIPSKSLVENSTLAMLTDAALSQGDYISAQGFCERLVSNALQLGKRVEQSRSDESGNVSKQTVELYEEVTSLAHRTCHQLSKQPDWTDHASRLRWAGFALAFCPAEQLGKYMENWRKIAHEFEQELQANPPKIFVDELQRSGLSRGGVSAASLGGGLSAALQAGTGGLSAAGLAALSQFGGSLESYANPLGALFSRGPAAIRPLAAANNSTSSSSNMTRSASQRSNSSAQNSSHPGGDLQANANNTGSPISRAARLFDGLGVAADGHSSSSGGGTPSEGMPGYMDPAERAARAARRFFSGFGTG